MLVRAPPAEAHHKTFGCCVSMYSARRRWMLYSLPSPWRLFRVLLRLDTFALGECRPPFSTTSNEGQAFAANSRWPWIDNGPKTSRSLSTSSKNAASCIGVMVSSGSPSWTPRCSHPDGVVVAFGVCARAPNGSSSFYGPTSVVEDDEVVPDVRPIPRWACVPTSYCLGGDVLPLFRCGAMEDNFGRLHASTSCLSHKPTARKNARTPLHHFFFNPSMSWS